MNVKYLISISLLMLNIACGADSFIDELIDSPDIEDKGITTDAVKDENVIFEDNFDQTNGLPDPAKWSLCTKMAGVPWANYLSQSHDQAYVKDGMLVLKGEKVNGIYKCGGIQTRGKVEFTYGKVEIRARFKSAQGGWPAIWMMPVTNAWPHDGEIDIMEEVSNKTYCVQSLHSNYINKLGYWDNPKRQFFGPFKVNEFNTYAINWTSEKIDFYINGTFTFSYPNLHLADEATLKQWPYNKPFYLILNYALGGPNTWPGTITDSELPGIMEVDWVKITNTV